MLILSVYRDPFVLWNEGQATNHTKQKTTMHFDYLESIVRRQILYNDYR